MVAKIRGEKPTPETPVEFWLEQRGKYVVLCGQRGDGNVYRLAAVDPDTGTLRLVGGCTGIKNQLGLETDEPYWKIGNPLPFRDLI